MSFKDLFDFTIYIMEWIMYDPNILFIFDSKNDKKRNESIEKLKQNAHQIKVNLQKAKIYSIGNKNRIKLHIQNQHIKSYTFSIEMDPVKLKLWFYTQKETILYINKNNVKDKYLDLEFMND